MKCSHNWKYSETIYEKKRDGDYSWYWYMKQFFYCIRCLETKEKIIKEEHNEGKQPSWFRGH